jgi:phospholipid transport system substrate-binding protein
MEIKRFIVAMGLLVLAVAAPVSGSAEPAPPRAVIERFHEAIIGVMKQAKVLGHVGRYKTLEPYITEVFHLPGMIQIASGSFWHGANEQQRKALIAAFTRFSVATYANNFDNYGGERFETIGERSGPQETTLVDTKIIKASGSSVDITYVLKSVQDQWRVLDVVVDKGISELALRRSEYSRVLRTSGVDGLVATLNQKADELGK